MSLDSWLHLVHVLSAMVWVGGGLMLSLIGARARSSSDPRAIADFARLLPFVGIRVLMPSVILVLLTGVGLVLADSEFRFSQLWVLLALALFAVAFLIGGAGAAPLLNRWLVGYWVVLAVLLVAVWDMVFKPGL